MSIQNIAILLILIKIIFVYFLYTEKSFYKLFFAAMIYGSSMFLFFYGRIPNDITGNHSLFSNIIIISFLILVQASFHTFYLITNFTKKIKNTYLKVFTFPTLLAISEFLIIYSMSIAFAKRLALDFVFSNTGFALSFTSFVYLAKWGHVFLLTFVFGLLISSLLELKIQKKFLILIVFCFLSVTYFNMNLFLKREEDKSYAELGKVLIKKEGARWIRNDFTKLYERKYDLIIDGDVIKEEGKTYNTSIFYDIKNDKKVINYKSFLVPFGEYLPSTFSWIKYIYPDVYDKMKTEHTYTVKDKNEVFVYNGKKIITLICSDAWSITSVRKVKIQKPDFVILQRSDTAFNYSDVYDANVLLWKPVLYSFLGTNVLDVNR